MSEDTSHSGGERPIEAFVADAQRLSAPEFEERHGSAFLLLTASALTRPECGAPTRVELSDAPDRGDERTAGVSVVVFPVRRGAGAAAHLVTIGRATNNDLVIPDLSVSRFHAFLKRENGSLRLQDAGSTNGTLVNASAVPTRGTGPPVALKPGDSVRLGQVDFTFLDAGSLRRFALKFAD